MLCDNKLARLKMPDVGAGANDGRASLQLVQGMGA